MILIQLNKEKGYENDIHSLVKAFFPPENVSVCAEAKKITEPVYMWMYVNYQSQVIRITVKIPLQETDTTESNISTCGGIQESQKKGKKRQEYQYQFETWKTVKDFGFTVDYEDRKDTKNVLKRELYQFFSEYTGKQLPWGTLTGIRPTKIPMSMLERGCTEDEIKSYMTQTYDTSIEKTTLSIEIARRELELLGRLDYKRGYSLYIGIPFCPGTCLYCSFTSYPLHMWASRVDEYLDALEKELQFTADTFKDRYLNSIYIGGGTPTTLTPVQMERLISTIRKRFDLSHLLEFTVEAGRPDSITRENLEILRANGITRISINPQTMKQQTLDLIGRHHTVEQTVECFHLARSLGFDNINMDLIMGLPQETLADVERTMDQLKQLDPDNITVHSLAVKRAARLNMFKEDYRSYKMINTQAHMDAAARICREMGMKPYYLYRQKNMAGNFENTGYAKAGRAGIYNILIMEEKQTIMALGAGAITKYVAYDSYPVETVPPPEPRIRRTGNVKDVSQYIERVDEMIQRKVDVMEELEWD